MPRLLIVLGAVCGACGVTLSALGAHRSGVPQLVTAANMLLFHAPVLLSLATISAQDVLPRRALTIIASLFAVGLLLFCGDLVARVVLGDRLFPFAAPLGGGAVIMAWIALAVTALWRKRVA